MDRSLQSPEQPYHCLHPSEGEQGGQTGHSRGGGFTPHKGAGGAFRGQACPFPVYLVLAFGADPHALGNVFERRVQAGQVVDAGAGVAHEQLAAASAHGTEVLMDVSLSGRTHASVSRPLPGRANHAWQGGQKGRGLLWGLLNESL